MNQSCMLVILIVSLQQYKPTNKRGCKGYYGVVKRLHSIKHFFIGLVDN